MNANDLVGNASPSPTISPPHKSGIRHALEFTGIPSSWLSKRPKLPSRNWLIFLSITSTIAGSYIYDRRQCNKIRQEYIDRVKHLADEPVDAMAWPRKVKVYGSKWPGDEDNDRSMKYFRRYLKPILVAAAVDFEMINGKRHGDLANQIADEIKRQRRLNLGIDQPPEVLMPLPTHRTPEEKRRHELEGGIVIVGRQTFKEFMTGLKRGWTNSLEEVDKDELLARELEVDGHFDEPEDLPTEDGSENSSSGPARLPSPNTSPVFSPLSIHSQPKPPPKSPSAPSIPQSLNTPPDSIPRYPPLLLVSFTDYIGFTQIPFMIWEFFNQRQHVRAGAEGAYRIIMKATRPFVRSDSPEEPLLTEGPALPPTSQHSDLDFDLAAEHFYKKSVLSIPSDIEKARKKYYEALPAKLIVARAISRGTRDMTKEEIENPPPTEVELRAERMKKERRWRGDLEGWEVIKPDQPVIWDERFRDALEVFSDIPPHHS